MKVVAYAALVAPAALAMITPEELVDSIGKCSGLPESCANSVQVLLGAILKIGGAGGDVKDVLAGLTGDCLTQVDACIAEIDKGSSGPAANVGGTASAAVEARGMADGPLGGGGGNVDDGGHRIKPRGMADGPRQGSGGNVDDDGHRIKPRGMADRPLGGSGGNVDGAGNLVKPRGIADGPLEGSGGNVDVAGSSASLGADTAAAPSAKA